MSRTERYALEMNRIDAIALAVRFHADTQKQPIFAKGEPGDLKIYPSVGELLETAELFEQFIAHGDRPPADKAEGTE